jgi:hypothetical protein
MRAPGWAHHLPSWREPAGKLLAAGVALAVFIFAAGIYSMFDESAPTRSSDPVFAPEAPTKEVQGPVAWRGQADIYKRLKRFTGCLPRDTAAIDRSFTGHRSLNGALRIVRDGTEQLRGLKFGKPPKPKFVTGAQMNRQLRKLVKLEYKREEAELDQKVLVALGALSPEVDLFEGSRSNPAAGVAGFYDPATKEVFVRTGSKNFETIDELTLVHELEHALADARFGLPLEGKPSPERADEQLAHRALVEGDASLTAAQYDLALSFIPRPTFINTSGVGQAVTNSGPPPSYFLLRSLYFPYYEGTLFACELYAFAGWDAVNRAYNEPPKTTAEILFPDRYLARLKPKDPTDPPRLGAAWKKAGVYSLGAADLLWLVQAPGNVFPEGGKQSAEPVQRWNGGEIHAWSKGSDLALAIGLVDGGFDTKGKGKPTPRLCQTVRHWYTRAFDGTSFEGPSTYSWRESDRVALLQCKKEGPRLALAPDLETAKKLIG